MPKVKEAMKLVKEDGWLLKRVNGSHRHYVHPEKPGKVTIAGKESQDLALGTYNSILKQAGIREIG